MPNDGTRPIELAIAQATRLVKDVPEDLRVAAFNKAFEALMGSSPGSERSAGKRTRSAPSRPRVPEEPIDEIMENLESTAYPTIRHGRSVIVLAMLTMQAVRESCDVEWLSAGQVLKVLKDKFRIPIKADSLNKALSRATAYVDRKQVDGTYMYRVMAPGEEYLQEQSVESGSGATKSGQRKRPKRKTQAPPKARRSTKGAGAPKAPAKGAASRSSSRGSAGRPGPKKLLEDLIAAGYFDSPRNISDIIKYASDKKAYVYKPTDLSPALARLQREEKLDRERNAENQFEYTRHPGTSK
jgi:hypothetical protein